MNFLSKWYAGYRGWEDDHIAMLDALNANRAPDPTWARSHYRRRIVDKSACLSYSERQQMRDFIWRYRGWRSWIALAALAAINSVIGLLVWQAWPGKLGALESAVFVNLLVLCLGVGFVGTWFNPGRFARFGKRSIIVIPLLAIAGALVGASITGLIKGETPADLLGRVGSSVVFGGLILGIILAALVTLIVSVRNRELKALNASLAAKADAHRLGNQVAESRLRLLQAQIEPHFLFNTLGAVQQLAEGRAPEAATLTAHLIKFLRDSMGNFREPVASLGNEIAVVESYLKIMQSRLGSRLTYTVDVPASLTRSRMQPTLLLTFVENAIKHGIEGSPRGGAIRISARASGSMLLIEVADSGIGMAEILGAGDGLRNVREQLRLAYGGNASLELLENEPSGLIVRLSLPHEELT